MESTTHDVIIIGGSYAGLQAAMTLGRSLRKVLVVDGGKPCNRQTPHSHNFLTHDGHTPAQIAAEAKAQLAAYPTLEFLEDTASSAVKNADLFEISTIFGRKFNARKLLFATGIADVMPNIKGFVECWGITVIHCPYCHGYEVRGQATGVFGNGDGGYEYVKMISHWAGGVTLFTNGASTLTDEQTSKLKSHQINIIETPVAEVVHQNGIITNVKLADGSKLPLAALYAHLPFKQHCELPMLLGCELTESGHIKNDGFGKTNVNGVYAAGDCVDPLRSVASAVRGGMAAAAFINKELINEDF
ncbi:NAD(P)/FAD-dependent oxidoreductase [Mucilaginibacter terrae]|uniref:Thioredoxin reductase n=1 Tax=Mucilaginibacter terrae TaxID=1955052 RepID=A0ABU3GR24_9SPHI|nr:NAD(P)/FAD-dependent oxidoreductase [Mucilaginibacter terrae]MDT3402085.1 thioredoxin reductase [Mucilaginibacter terrae]